MYVLELLRLKTTVNPVFGNDVEQLNPRIIAGEDVKWYRHFEKHFGGVLESLIVLLGFTKILETVCLPQSLHMDV